MFKKLALAVLHILAIHKAVCNFETPVFKYLPPYFGCFHASIYSEIQTELEGSHFYFRSLGVHPADCIGFCASNSIPFGRHNGTEIAAIKGQLCICATIRDKNATSFRKVANKLCNLDCPSKLQRSLHPGKVIYRNEFCGGNIPYSIYCASSALNKSAAPGDYPLCEQLWLNSAKEHHLHANDLKDLDTARPQYSCAICVDHPNICPTKTETALNPHTSNRWKTHKTLIHFEYSPRHSAIECINQCRRIFNTTHNFVAILGNSTASKGKWSVDTCFCIRATGFNNVDGFIAGKNCGDTGYLTRNETPICGNQDDILNTRSFLLYGNFSEYDNEYECLETTRELPVVETSSLETTEPIIIEPTTTATAATIREPSENTTLAESTTEKRNPSTMQPVKSTATPAPSTPKIYTSVVPFPTRRTTAAVKPPCLLKCSEYESRKGYWIGCAGELVVQPCHNDGGNSSPTASWHCGPNGKFITAKPNFENCTTGWIEEMRERANQSEIESEEAIEMLHLINEKCANASKPEYDSDSSYFAHEITPLYNLGYDVLCKVHSSEIEVFENLTSYMVLIVSKILSYDEIWLELRAEEKSKTGTSLLSGIEGSLFVLTSRAVNNRARINADADYYYKPFFPDTSLLAESGVLLKSKIMGESLTFPRNVQNRNSFLRLPGDWMKALPSDDDEAEYVGIQIDRANASELFQVEPNKTDECYFFMESATCVNATRILNSNMLSFTFGSRNNKSETTFLGAGVQISFEHDIEAWGSKRPVRRRLFLNEKPKAVQDSAACVFWDAENQEWSSVGCKVVETSRARTVCECSHLTAFALLMDTHRYEGNEQWLEIVTLVISPLSAICLLACIVLLIRVREVKGPRTTITTHLCFCLLIGMVLVITVMNRNYFWLSDDMCMVAAMLVHYIFLCAFSWMALEGALLYRMVILVFDTERHYMTLQLIGAYVTPLGIVGMTYGIGLIKDERAYGGDEYCWLEENYRWAFMGPVALVTTVNLAIVVATLRKARNLQKSAKAKVGGQKRKKSVLSWLRGTFGVTVLVGGTWLFGFLMAINDQTLSQIFAYLFTVLNASQGIFLFVFQCMLNKNVRHSLRGNLPAWISISTLLTRTGSSSSKLKFMTKTDSHSFSDKSRRNSPEGLVEQTGRREIIPDY